MRKTAAAIAMTAALFFTGGCVHRSLTIRSNPDGALVYLNDQEFGRTPVTRELTWYGTYQVEIRKEGFETIKTTAKVWAPWWQWVPFDLFAELLPLKDKHELQYTLREPTTQEVSPEYLIERGEQMQKLLESGERPATQPATRPAKAKKQKPPKN